MVGVLPAAGHAVRLQPLDRSKEMIEVGGRPVIDYLVERMRAAGCEDLRVVTRPEKEDIVAYADGIGASVVLAYPETINESFAAGLRDAEPETIVLLGFPDSLWQPVDGFRALVAAVESGREVALGLFESPGLTGSDFVTLDGSGRITGFHIKPATPPSTWIWGCAAARARALEGIEREEWPSAFMDSLQRGGVEVAGVPLSDAYLDIGTPQSLRRLPELAWTRRS
jgi:glucose-1-phosphate thymidylyltransferase